MRIIDCNELAREQFGADSGEFCFRAYKGRMSKCRFCAVQDTFTTGKPQQNEEVFTNLKGEEVFVQVHTTPLFNEKGQVERVLEISSDISRIKKIQKQLYNGQQQLQHSFDEAPCYVTVQDRNLRITRENRHFREDFGSGVGNYCYETYKHRDEPCLECPVAMTFEDGKSHQSEEVVTAMSGEQYNVLVSTAALRDGAGKISHVVEMSTDITQVRQLQDQLTSLGLLVGSISHGIRSLATNLDGGMYMVGSGIEKNDRERIGAGWDIIKRNVDRIRSMISDIIYYAKSREAEYEAIDIDKFMSDIFTTTGSKAKSLNVEFEFVCEPDLGEFTIDQVAMRSALLNILENSFDACRRNVAKKEHKVSFRIEADDDAGEVHIHVIDDGIGMDQETQEKIFSLFFSSKGQEGTGLGLFISNKVIKQHNGVIHVASKQGQGAHFHIVLPRSAI